MGDHIETNRLGERSALSNSHNITILDFEGWGAMGSHILVTLFETTVLLDVMQIVPSDDNSALHFRGDNKSLEDTSSNRDMASKGTLLVHIVALNGSRWSLDAQTNLPHITHRFLALLGLATNGTLSRHENGILLLVCLFELCNNGENLHMGE